VYGVLEAILAYATLICTFYYYYYYYYHDDDDHHHHQFVDAWLVCEHV